METLAAKRRYALLQDAADTLERAGYDPHTIPMSVLRRELASHSFTNFFLLYGADEFVVDLAPIHWDMIADCEEITHRLRNQETGVKIARAYPRGIGKSTFFARLLPTYCFLFGLSPLTVLLGNNDDAARRLLVNIKHEIETNSAIQQDFPEYTSRGRTKIWGSERLQNNDGSTIVAFGVGSGSLRGVANPKRPSLVVVDDADDDRTAKSQVELENAKNWFEKSVLYLGDNVRHTTHYVVIGTLLSRTSLLYSILQSPDFTSHIESYVHAFSPREDLWNEWKSRLLALAKENQTPTSPEHDTFYQEHKEAMLAGTQVLWDRPNAYYHAMLARLRSENAFWSELQNQPRVESSLYTELTRIARPSINLHEYRILAYLDPTTSAGRTSDQAAYVELLYHPKRRECVLWYADSKIRAYTETIDVIIQRLRYLQLTHNRTLDGFWVETNSAGSVIKDLLHERLQRDLFALFPTGVNNHLPKHDRIQLISEYARRQQFFLVNDIPQQYVDQIENYPNHRFDDVIDAIGSLLLQLRERGLLSLALSGSAF